MAAEGTPTFGEALRRYRTAAALSQEDLAERAGLSARGVSDLERGVRRAPRLETVRLLADVLGLGLAERASLIAARGAAPGESGALAGQTAARLPAPLAPFVGRERETGVVRALLRHRDVRLLTLTGPGGVGKTRLALHVAADLAAEFAGGTGSVALAPIANPAFVAPAIAQALVFPVAGGQEPVEALTAFLGDRKYLLVLDNFEQVLGAAPLVAALLAACPRLKVLVTSREVLHIYGEQAYLVPPMSLDSDAVRLFVNRARAADAAFALTDENAPHVAAICARLDGLPLALELAAARVAHLPPAALLTRLERRLPLLTGGPRDLPTRLRTMRDAIAWSYDLLDPAEERLFRRLAVFVGGFTLEAAEWVMGVGCWVLGDDVALTPKIQDPTPAVFDGVSSLASKSLVRRLDGDQDGARRDAATPRFGMLETIREYGLERLAASGDEDEVRAAHHVYFLALALQAKAAWFGGEQGRWFDRIHGEHDNVRAALDWAIARDDAETAQRLAGALWIFWFVRGHFAEGRTWLERSLAIDGRTPLTARIDATFGAGQLARHQGDARRARELAEAVLAEPEAAQAPLARALALFLLGNAHGDLGDLAGEEAMYQEALALFAAHGDDDWAARTLGKLGAVARLRGDLEGYQRHSERKLGLHRASGNAWGAADALSNLAEVARLRGDATGALALRREALNCYVAVGNRLGILETLRGIATIAAANHRPALAVRLCGAEETRRRADGVVLAADEQARHASFLASVRATMGGATFAVAWQSGAAWAIETAVGEALAFALPVPSPPGPADDAATRFGLTRREREIVRLLAQRLTDKEIAVALSISPKTAMHHTASVLAKLSLASRRDVPAFAAAHDLLSLTDEPGTE